MMSLKDNLYVLVLAVFLCGVAEGGGAGDTGEGVGQRSED